MLASKLYDMIQDVTDEDLGLDRKAIFIWNWKWLYANQSAETIRENLQDIEELISSNQTLKALHILFLAWKAEALEALLTQ